MSCETCSRRLKSGILVPAGYEHDETTGDWIGPRGQRLKGDDVEKRPTRTLFRFLMQKIR
jgi:hypothetical protein